MGSTLSKRVTKTPEHTKEMYRVSAEVLEQQAWYDQLDPSMKDGLGQRNFNESQAKAAVELALLVQAALPEGDE